MGLDVIAGVEGTHGVLDRLVAERRKEIDGPLTDRDALVKQTRARVAEAHEECSAIDALMTKGGPSFRSETTDAWLADATTSLTSLASPALSTSPGSTRTSVQSPSSS